MKNKDKYVIITGDKHGNLSSVLNLDNPDNKPVIIVGDFGLVWATEQKFYDSLPEHKPTESFNKKYGHTEFSRYYDKDEIWGTDGDYYINKENLALDALSELPFEIFFLDGNHENFRRLYEYPEVEKYGGRCGKVRENIFHMKRGEVFDIEGLRILAFGGAFSHDIHIDVLGNAINPDPFEPDFVEQFVDLVSNWQNFRIKHISWWEEEQPNENEMKNAEENLEKVDWEVDVVLTHQAPPVFERLLGYPANVSGKPFGHQFPDFLTKLSVLVEYKKWFFGHYHQDRVLWPDKDGEKYVRVIYHEFEEVKKDD